MKQFAVLLLQLVFIKVNGDAVSEPAQFQYYIPPPVILTAPSTSKIIIFFISPQLYNVPGWFSIHFQLV